MPKLLSLTVEDLPDKGGALFIVTMHSKPDNRFTYEFIREWNEVLDTVEDTVLSKEFLGKAAALITTHGSLPGEEAKQKLNVYSNGLLLDLLMRDGVTYVKAYQKLLERVLTFRLPTIASIDGHAFAGGCMLALAHDYRVMNATRGFLCMNEVELPGGLTPGMMAIVRCKISCKLALKQCVLEARRFSAKEALDLGMIDSMVDPKATSETVLTRAKQLAIAPAKRFAKASTVFHYLKKEYHAETSAKLLAANLGYVWNNLEDISLLNPEAKVTALLNRHGQAVPLTRRLFKL